MSILYDNKEYFGKHLIVNIEGCCKQLKSIDFWKNWYSELLTLIDMKPFGKLTIAEFGENDLLGISAVQLIYTSSITMHTYYKTMSVYLDVFSCKEYDEKKVLIHLIKHLRPDKNKVYSKTIYR